MSSAKFHVNPATGNPGKCGASAGKCPFGSLESHYGTAEEASRSYEERLASLSLAPRGEWLASPWSERKKTLEKMVEEIGANLGITRRSSLSIIWVDSIAPGSTAVGRAGYDPKSGSLTISLSNRIAALEEVRAKEIVVHELGHLMAPRDRDHGHEWNRVSRAIAKRVEGLENLPFSGKSSWTAEELDRMAKM